jgi:hypothetical protein
MLHKQKYKAKISFRNHSETELWLMAPTKKALQTCLIEVLLQLFICQVDTKLLKAVKRK